MSQSNDAFIEIHRDSVQTWESDQMGHLNVQFYMEKAQSGLASLFAEMGLGPRALRAAGQRLDVQDHHVRFLREQRPGAPFYLVGGVLSAQPDLFVVYEEMRATLGDTPAATFRAEVRLVDDATGAPVPFPQAVIDAGGKLRGELPKHGMPRGLTLNPPRAPITLAQAEERGLIATYQGEVLERMCDGQGYMNKRHYMGLVSDSIPNLLVKTRGDDRSNNGNIGGAALEYRFVYFKRPKCGDILKLRSGLKQVTEKTYTWSHLMFDGESGEMIAASEAVAIALDLVARKAIPVPEEMRKHLSSLVIDGIGV